MRRKRNGTKLLVLRHLESRGWQTPLEVARAVGLEQSWQSMWHTLARYEHCRLVVRRRVPYIEYAITGKGRERRAWLERMMR